jgi:hypothetical protein
MVAHDPGFRVRPERFRAATSQDHVMNGGPQVMNRTSGATSARFGSLNTKAIGS